MDEVRILSRILAAGAKPDLPFFFVDALNAPHDVITFGDLCLGAPRFRVDEIKMTPPIALRNVDKLVRFFEPVYDAQAEILGMRCPDEGLGFLVNDMPRLAR